ncbi:hypothetical protein D3C80_1437830 [compost metagenome]
MFADQAIEFIQRNGLYLAGQHVATGAMVKVRVVDGTIVLAYLDLTKNSPLRAIVPRDEGGYRVASPHLTPVFEVEGLAPEVAMLKFFKETGYAILDIAYFRGARAPELPVNPYPTPDRSGWVPIKFAIQANNHKIIEAVKAAGGNIRDTHRFEKMIQVSHVALFGVPGYKEQVVCLLEGQLFCLNPIGLDHDEPYLSTCAVGGNLEHKELPMEERLATYQDWGHNMLWNLVRVDGK